VQVVNDPEALARTAANLAVTALTKALDFGDGSYLALSGGSTPKRMGEILSESHFRELDLWAKSHIFWGDERWVPLDDPQSNAGVAMRTFLDVIPVPDHRIFPFPVDADRPETAASTYDRTVALTVPSERSWPRFDLVFLGMGDDGHTASLFPHTEALSETSRIAVANPVPQLNTTRLTLTAPVINNARQVVFLVSGAGKAARLAEVLEGPERPETLPSQLIRPTHGELLWLVDKAAASHLSRRPG
jgi:6-phosphogluconolactonase